MEAVGGIVGSVGSALIGGRAARRAAQAQQQASADTIRTGQQQLDRVTGLTQQSRDIGSGAMNQLNTLAQQYATPIDASAVQNEAGYQFGLNQGLNNVQNTAAAKGGLYSGNALKALTQYGNDYATTKYGDAYNRIRQGQGDNWQRYSQLTDYGNQGNQQLMNAGQNYTILAANALGANGAARGNSEIAQGKLWGDAFNSAASGFGSAMAGSMKTPGLGGGSGRYGNFGGDYNSLSFEQRYADGGAVRREPVIGSRSPLRTGGGGGLSADAVRQAMMQAKRQEMAEKYGIGALTANPLTNPEEIARERERQAMRGYACGGAVRKNYMDGGEVDGPGGPRDDAIPAYLSDGEHVMDAESVAQLGGGNPEVGHMKLNLLRMILKA